MQSPLPSGADIDDALVESLTAHLKVVEDELHRSVDVSDALLQWSGRHLLDAGGKRMRPLLVMLGATFGDLDRPEVRDAAVLVELTHLASLYHDDVMDSAPTRRGARSAHQVWGNSVAILTGDFLFARASARSARLGPDVVRMHADTFERLCIGQLHETVGPGPEEDPFAHYISVLSDKTASLIAAAAELGAMTSGAPTGIAGRLRTYGEKAGIAFQLADDVLDLRRGPTPGPRNSWPAWTAISRMTRIWRSWSA
jgi:heptaprenyl diphosphate synthase